MSSMVAAGEVGGGGVGGMGWCGSWRCEWGQSTNKHDIGNTSNIDEGEMEQGGKKKKKGKSWQESWRTTVKQPLERR